MNIKIIGAGVIGLTSGIRLLEAGHTVQIVANQIEKETTSHKAAAIWFPFHVAPVEKTDAWGERTIEVYYRENAQGVGGLKPIEFRYYSENDPEPPGWMSLTGGGKDLGKGELPPLARYGWATGIYRIDASIYMPYLKRTYEKLDGRFEQRNLAALSDVMSGCDLVVNCSGVWAKQLASDPKVFPIRGQIIAIERPQGFPDVAHSFDTTEAVTYVIPREREVILGGTTQDGDWNLTPDPKTAAGILERCGWFEPRIANAKIIEHRVGLRPDRDAVRLELEKIGDFPVIHSYGHGGGGFTLCWGCADDVARLVGNL